MGRDSRRVQTAVIGDAESEMPISLPREAIELDRFRAVYAEATFWCGHWLGGCGTQLTTKLYLDRSCHFAHFPHHPPHCAPACRRAAGVDGADHLYVKAALLGWLNDQDIAARARIPRDPDGTVHAGTVLVEPDNRTALRIVLHQGAAGPGDADAEALLGVSVAHDPRRLTIPGYVHRIRCHSEGTDRHVMIGTQQHRGTDWFALTDCTLDEQGLTTPALAEIRRLRTTPRPLGQPRPRPTLVAPAPPTPTPDSTDTKRSEAFEALEQALISGSTPADLQRLRKNAERSVPGAPTSREGVLLQEVSVQINQADQAGRTGRHLIPDTFQQRRSLLRVNTTLKRLDSARHDFTAARALVRELTREAAQVDRWLTPQQRTAIGNWQRSFGIRTASATTPSAPRKPHSATQRSSFTALCEALHDVLVHAAHLGQTMRYEKVCEQVAGFRELSQNGQRKAMDTAGTTGVPGPLAPHLAALISGDDGEPLPNVLTLLREHGRYVPKEPDQVRALWHAEVLAAFRHYNRKQWVPQRYRR